jgi:hypothetical protein
VLVAGLFWACDSKTTGDNATANGTENNAAPANDPDPAAMENKEAEKTPAPSAEALVFMYHDVTYGITLTVVKKASSVDYTIEVANTDNGCKHTLKGTAKAKGGDLESREVEGEGVFVQEYVADDAKCYLTISIDLDTESYAWISQGECPDIEPLCKLDPGTYLSLTP